MFAVIKTGGKQYKVAPGDTITIEKLPTADQGVTFSEVLLLGGEKTVVGQPTVAGAKVTAEVVASGRGAKIRVFKYQAKSHWSRTHGHRQELTQVRIKDIVSENGKKSSAVKEERRGTEVPLN